MADQNVTVGVCAKMVEAATQTCQPVATMPVTPTASAADAMSGLAVALTYGSIILAILALLAGFGWAKFVAHEAKELAIKDAESYIAKWMAEKAPSLIQKHVEFLQDASIGDGDDDVAADNIGKGA